MQYKIRKLNPIGAITIVELILVIVILVILATIGFISIQKYTSKARDTQRIQNLKLIEEAISQYEIKNGYFPLPNNLTHKSYIEGGEFFNGVFGEENTQKVEILNQILKDPKTEKKFLYSVSKNGKSYILKTFLETGDEFILKNPIYLSRVGANDNPYSNIPTNLKVVVPDCKEYLTQTEADELNTLTGESNTIESWCTATYLRIENQDFSSGVPDGIGKLTRLRTLVMNHNNLNDLSFLENLDLGNLQLKYNKIVDLKSLKKLKNLYMLNLDNNQISNLEALSGLTNLTNLSLSNNQISNLEALSGLTNLKYLSLSNNQISNLEALSGLTNLTSLYLDNNQIVNIGVLSSLTSLIYLELYNNQIVDVGPLKTLINLITLSLDNNQIVDVSELLNLNSLKIFSLGNNNLDISKFEQLFSKLDNLLSLDLKNSSAFLSTGDNFSRVLASISNNQFIEWLSFGSSNLQSLEATELLKLDGKLKNLDFKSNTGLGNLGKMFSNRGNIGKYCNTVGTNGENICIENIKGQKIKITVE